MHPPKTDARPSFTRATLAALAALTLAQGPGCAPVDDEGAAPGRATSEVIAPLFTAVSLAQVPAAVQRRFRNTERVARSRFVRASRANLAALTRADSAVRLNLFDDAAFDARGARVVARGAERATWFGRVADDQSGQASILVHDGRLRGHVNARGRSYELRDVGEGLYLIRELRAWRPEGEPRVIDVTAIGGGPFRNPTGAAASGSSTIDLMVVATDAARQGAEADTGIPWGLGIFLEILLGVDETNRALEESLVGHRIRLVRTNIAAFDEYSVATMNDQLAWLDNEVRTAGTTISDERDAYAADLVSLWVEDGLSACGIAHRMINVSAAFADSATSVVDRNCQYKYSFSHELGHNFGAHHDTFVAGGATTAYPYSFGYVFDVPSAFGLGTLHRRTMMAYEDECTANGYACARVLAYSTPRITYGFTPLYTPQPIGTAALEDNARTIANTGATVAAFR
jgi:hypothetical protein